MEDRKETKNKQKKGGEKEMRKSEKGITLIALIITIIILVILAGVSIRAVYNMGIVTHAIKGTQDYAEGAVEEKSMLGETGNTIDSVLARLKEIQGGNEGTTLDPNGWDIAWTYNSSKQTNEGWSSGITDNSTQLEGDIIAKAYKTGKKVNHNEGQFDEYLLLITGSGAMGPLRGNAWKAFTLDLRYGISTVSIGNGITSIGDYAFEDCTNLTRITIPNSVTSIGGATFRGCSSLTSITIPNSVTSIGGGAFSDCTNLTSITIPNSVTSIGNEAFLDCTNLMSITIPNSVTSLGDFAFLRCSNLQNLAVGSVISTERLFENFNSIRNVTILDGATSIGDGALMDCTNLTSITIPNSVTSIVDNAFCRCTNLTSITIPNSVTNLGESLFNGCTNLTSINIPNSVTSIGTATFYMCDNLTDVYFGGTRTEWNNISIGEWNDVLSTATIHCQEELVVYGSMIQLVDESGNQEDILSTYNPTMVVAGDTINLSAYIDEEYGDISLINSALEQYDGETATISLTKDGKQLTWTGTITTIYSPPIEVLR